MRNRNHNRRIATVLVAALAALVGALCLSAAASAQTIYNWKYDGTYPASEANAVIDRFNALSTTAKQHMLNFLRSL